LTTLALDSRRGFPIPGEQAFPFPSLFKPPANAQDEGFFLLLKEIFSNIF